jgi:hypothetical protein
MKKNILVKEPEGCPGIEQIGDGPYSEAPEVKLIADELIKKHHPHLEGVNICYLFRSDRWVARKKPVRGKALIAPPLWQHVGGFELIVIINKTLFDSMNNDGRVVMVDNEISSFEKVKKETGKKAWQLREHDICEYSDVLARHNVCVSNLIPVIKGEMVQLTIMESLNTKVTDVERIASVYPPTEIEDEEVYLCEDYEELIKNDPRYEGLR